MFCYFWQKFENSKWLPSLVRGKFFENCQEDISQNTLGGGGGENFDKIALSHTVKEIEANLCFAIFGKNSKWPPFLGRGKFSKIAKSTLLRYPVGRKF